MPSHQHIDPSQDTCPWYLRDKQHELILLNDDVNTFGYVIECLIEVCEHTGEQAEQCAILAHTKGWCVVKTAPLELLRKMSSILIDRGLLVRIE